MARTTFSALPNNETIFLQGDTILQSVPGSAQTTVVNSQQGPTINHVNVKYDSGYSMNFGGNPTVNTGNFSLEI